MIPDATTIKATRRVNFCDEITRKQRASQRMNMNPSRSMSALGIDIREFGRLIRFISSFFMAKIHKKSMHGKNRDK